MKPFPPLIGTRVVDEFLGPGVIVGIARVSPPGVFVQFDKTPPEDYNLGVNPAFRFLSTMEPEEAKP